MTAGAEAPATGAAGDRFAAALHAMRSRGSPAPWVDALLDREGATDRLPGFAELRLLIGLRRVVDSGEVHGLTEVAHAARKLHAQRGSESAIGLFVLMNEAAARSASSADLELAERAQQLAPEDFPLFAVGGTLALQLDDWTRAAASFERAAALQPHSVHAAAGLCRALIGAGRFGEVDARLQGDVFASTAAGRAQRDLLTGIGLYRRAMLASDPAAADAAATGPTRARALFEQARAAFERAREATADRAPTSLEELMCDAMLGGELAADQAFDLLADAPLDAYLLRELARRLPAALDAHEVSALRRFMLLQAEALGMRTR